jgi:hypothetical protein
VQKRAPSGNGEAQPAQARTGGPGGEAGATGRDAVAGSTGAAAGGWVDAGGWVGAAPEGAAVATPRPAAVGSPQRGHATHEGSSSAVRHDVHRFGANGSATPQKGHAATSRKMSLSQDGQGCLYVGTAAPLLSQVAEDPGPRRDPGGSVS